ncbi:hypothetical protein DPMN_042901 [Dreissena polymorpha]|uniref:Uncharacterized protein n=1 Tax=Dreissena polymorpha TaxID=45954 RepID=A0A9D4D2W7_DREPO|nr:hypothetical protein DPMN_042901 [Dreissena polymorpha]
MELSQNLKNQRFQMLVIAKSNMTMKTMSPMMEMLAAHGKQSTHIHAQWIEN